MPFTPRKTLDSQQITALNYFLVEGVLPREASTTAGIDAQRFNGACDSVAHCFRGHAVHYNRFLAGENLVDADPLRLDYELRLCRLQAQHQRCVENFCRTDDYTRQVLKNHRSQEGVAPLTNKAITGDIRFLQLAQSIRREMDQLEVKLQERIEELAAYYERTEASRKAAEAASPPSTPPTTPSSSPPPNQPPAARSSTPIEPQTQSAKTVTETTTPAQRLAPIAKPSPLLSREEFLAALDPRSIPTIPQPARKPDKYQATPSG
jgi:hypothetical protein